MTLPGDPPDVRRRAVLGGLRSRGVFQIVAGAAVLTFSAVAAVHGAAWWTPAIGVLAGLLLEGSGALALRVAQQGLVELEEQGRADAAAGAIAESRPVREQGPADAAPGDDDVSGGGGA